MRAHVLDHRIVAKIVVRAITKTGFVSEIHEFPAFLDRGRQRFFAHHVFASLERGFRNREVQEIWRAYVDHVDRRVTKCLVIVGRRSGNTNSRCQALGVGDRVSHDDRDFDTSNAAQGLHVCPPHEPGANDRCSMWFHISL
jgi:hypothetical protein